MIKDQSIIDIFNMYDQKELLVYMDNSTIYSVWNIACGYDMEDEYAHIITNISPDIENAEIDFFYTNKITKIIDAINGNVLFEPK